MIYVTSDLHGCSLETLQKLLDKAGFSQRDFLFVLGDVIDRGENAAQLLLWLTEQTNVQLILGNHEAMMLLCDFLFREVTEENLEELTDADFKAYEHWMRNGAATTIQGLKQVMADDPSLLEGILEYLREASLYEDLEVNGKRYVLVHGGLGNFHPEKSLEEYEPHDILWERPKMDTRYYENATVVFGHTPTVFYGEEYRGKAIRTETWINIDTGAAMGDYPMLLRLDDEAAFYVE